MCMCTGERNCGQAGALGRQGMREEEAENLPHDGDTRGKVGTKMCQAW